MLKWVQLGKRRGGPLSGIAFADQDDLLLTSMSGAIVSQIAEYVVMALLALGHQLPKMHGTNPNTFGPVRRKNGGLSPA